MFPLSQPGRLADAVADFLQLASLVVQHDVPLQLNAPRAITSDHPPYRPSEEYLRQLRSPGPPPPETALEVVTAKYRPLGTGAAEGVPDLKSLQAYLPLVMLERNPVNDI